MTAKQDSEDESRDGIPYAACNNCRLWSWAETEDEAKDRADQHEDRFDGHTAFWGTTVEAKK